MIKPVRRPIAKISTTKTIATAWASLSTKPWMAEVTGGYPDQIRTRLDEFMTFDSEVLAISCDPTYSLRAFADQDGLNFPLLSDFWPHGVVTAAYDVFDDTRGRPRRSSYVVDKQGLVRWSVHHPTSEGRDLDEHLRQLHQAADDVS